MNWENGKTSDLYRVVINLTDKMNLPRGDKLVALSDLSICYTLKNIKKSWGSNEFKTSVTTCDEEFEISDGSYYVSDIQDYLEYVIKKHDTLTNKSTVQI